MLILAVIVSIAMDNRERILGKVRVLNKRYLNPCTLNNAGRLNSPYAMLRQVGRRSGSVYTTPIVADFAQSWDGFVIPLPYGVNTDWYTMSWSRPSLTRQWRSPNCLLCWILPSLRRILLPLLRFLCDVSSSFLPRRGIALGTSVQKRAP